MLEAALKLREVPSEKAIGSLWLVNPNMFESGRNKTKAINAINICFLYFIMPHHVLLAENVNWVYFWISE